MSVTEIVTTIIVALIGGISPIVVVIIKNRTTTINPPPGDSDKPGLIVPANWEIRRPEKQKIRPGWFWIVILALAGGLTGYIIGNWIDMKAQPESTPAAVDSGLEMEITWLSGNQVKVTWENLPSQDNLYLMTADANRYYAPNPINETSGERIIPINSGITCVAIVVLEGVSPANFPNSGVAQGDAGIRLEVQIQKPIPPK